MNRRNVLMGLGTIVVGGGAALGSGAFSSVEARRSVNLGTAGDASALIGLQVSGDLQSSEGDDDEVIAFDLENDLNLDAVTTFSGAFTVTNNRATEEESVEINIYDGEGTNGASLINDDSTNDGMNFVTSDTSSNDPGDVPGNEGTVTFDVVFDLTDQQSTDAADGVIPDRITIEAIDNSTTESSD